MIKLKSRSSGIVLTGYTVLNVNLGAAASKCDGTACFTWRRLSFDQGSEVAAFLWVVASKCLDKIINAIDNFPADKGQLIVTNTVAIIYKKY